LEALEAIEASRGGDYRFLERIRVAYFDAKLAGWEPAKLYARENALPVVTIFPGTAVGAGDLHRSISRLVDGVWEGRLRLSLEGGTSFVAASDVGRGALLALENGRIGEGYIVSGRDEHNLDYDEFMDIIAALARAEGRLARRHPPRLPYNLALASASVAEFVAPNCGLDRAFLLSSRGRNACSSAKARSELGYESAESLEPAILACRRFSRFEARAFS
jgi:nucleoside-diphosphate-sugar epimerase